MRYLHAKRTDVGRVRKSNQDAIYANDENNFYLVADGMGGHKGGDIASQMAVDLLPKHLQKQIDKHKDPTKNREALGQATLSTNNDIHSFSLEKKELKGMGTTAVGLWFQEEKLTIVNIGDSRAYLIQDNFIYQLTQDHSLIQAKINMGIYTRERAMQDKMTNVLVRTLGHEPGVEVDTYTYSPKEGDLFLLCSDGLHGPLGDKGIQESISHFSKSHENALSNEDSLNLLCNELVDLANKSGGQDNISCILVSVIL